MRHGPTSAAQNSTTTRGFATVGAPTVGQAAGRTGGDRPGTVPLVCSVLGGVTKEASASRRVSKASSPMPTEDLKQRPCCGLGCENCPYEPRHQKGNTTLCAGQEKSAAIAPADLRYWGDVNDAVAKQISTLPPADQAKAASGQVSVLGSCGHSIRQGDNGVTVEIGKKCFTCLQADAPLRKAGRAVTKSAAILPKLVGKIAPLVRVFKSPDGLYTTARSYLPTASVKTPWSVTHYGGEVMETPAGHAIMGEARAIANPRGGWSITTAGVHPDFRRQGVATRMYDEIDTLTGSPVKPSGYQSPDAQKFWASRAVTKEAAHAYYDIRDFCPSCSGTTKSAAIASALRRARNVTMADAFRALESNSRPKAVVVSGARLARRASESADKSQIFKSGSMLERFAGIAAPMEKSAASLLRAAGAGLRAAGAAGAGLARVTSRLPKNHGIPNQFVGAVEDALATNSRLVGRRGLGMINSVDDVTRRNPNLRYMGSAEARLPGAKQHGVGVVDYFQAGVDDVGTAGGRQMSPMVMRQRYRTGYDPSGKAIYDKANVDVIKQPMYVSSGSGSGASSAGRWVPFSGMQAPANAATAVRRLHAADPRLASRLSVAPVNPGASGNSPWLGKHVNMVDAQGNLIRENLAHADDVAAGLGRWSKEALPPHLEAAQEVLNRFYGLNKSAAEAASRKVQALPPADRKAPDVEIIEKPKTFKVGSGSMLERLAGIAAPKLTAGSKSSSFYGYPVREPFSGEADYFAKNPHVAGMAAEDRKIVLNPHSKNTAQQQEAVARNEGIRLWMEDNQTNPGFAVTEQQNQAFRGTAYENNAMQLKRTIIARYLTGDPSAGDLTPEQVAFADDVRRKLPGMEKDAKDTLRAQRETYRKRKAAREPMAKSASTIREALQSLRRAWQGAVKAGPNLDGMFDAGAGHILSLPARGTDRFSPHISHAAGTKIHGESLDDLRKVWRGGVKSDEWLPLSDARTAALYETVISPPDIVSRLPEAQLFRVRATDGLPNRAGAQEVTSGGRIFKGIPRPGVIATAGESGGIPGAIGQLLKDRHGFRRDVVDGQWFTGLPSVAEGYAASNGSKFLSPRASMPSLSWDRVDVNARELVDRVRAWHSDVTEQFKRPYQRLRNQMAKSAAITPFEKLARYRRFDHAHPNPSQAQIASQNFKMGHLDFHGIDITIENEKGSVRRGTTKEGKKWESVLTCPYGYIRSAAGGKSGERVRPKARDGDHIDVFVGPNKSSELVVVVDQYLGGEYDESKFVLGCDSQDEGVQLYRSNYQRGWPEMPSTVCTVQQLREWLKNGKHKKAFKGQLVKAARSVFG